MKIEKWIMRQAGRYLPEYNKIKNRAGSFIKLCLDSELITEVTLQPIRRFNMDYAIIFSDILLVLFKLGYKVQFGNGILITKEHFEFSFDGIYSAIRSVKKNTDKKLIGFIGSPWTVSCYATEGKSGFTSISYIDNKLIDKIKEESKIFLSEQIQNGCDVVKIFDSWSGMLNDDTTRFNDLVIKQTADIVSFIKQKHPNIPIIGFPRGSSIKHYEKYIAETGIDCIACDENVGLDFMSKWSKKIKVQGNLDPKVLLTDQYNIEKETKKILDVINENWIFNLGHGILPNTPVDNVDFLIKMICA